MRVVAQQKNSPSGRCSNQGATGVVALRWTTIPAGWPPSYRLNVSQYTMVFPRSLPQDGRMFRCVCMLVFVGKTLAHSPPPPNIYTNTTSSINTNTVASPCLFSRIADVRAKDMSGAALVASPLPIQPGQLPR